MMIISVSPFVTAEKDREERVSEAICSDIVEIV